MKSIKDLIDLGSGIAGSTTGALVGLGLAGPPGAVAGAITGPIISKIIRKIADEVANRFLSQNERKRIGAVLIYAGQKIEKIKKVGLTVRDDDFFKVSDGRSTAEEIVEGVLLTAQREYQEKKLPFQGNLLANIAFYPEIKPAQANYLIKLAGSLTYRQLCLLSLIAQKEKFSLKDSGTTSATVVTDPDEFSNESLSLIQELHALFSQGIVTSEHGGIWVDTLAIRPGGLILKGVGLNLFKLMSLDSIENKDLESLAKDFRTIPKKD